MVLFLSLLLFPIHVQARITGDTLDASEFPPEVCLMEVMDSSNTLISTCSATAIHSLANQKTTKSFLTAAHCVDFMHPKDSFKIRCGSQSSIGDSYVAHPLRLVLGQQYDSMPELEAALRKSQSLLKAPEMDMAVLKTKDEVRVPQMLLYQGEDEAFDRLAEKSVWMNPSAKNIRSVQLELRMAGYGLDNELHFLDPHYPEHRDNRDVILRASVASVNVDHVYLAPGLFKRVLWYGRSAVQQGDSGGALYVMPEGKRKKKKQKTLLGVLDRTRYSVPGQKPLFNSAVMITSQNKEWILRAIESSGSDLVSVALAFYNDSWDQWVAEAKTEILGKYDRVHQQTKEFAKTFRTLKDPLLGFSAIRRSTEIMQLMGEFYPVAQSLPQTEFPSPKSAEEVRKYLLNLLDYDSFLRMKDEEMSALNRELKALADLPNNNSPSSDTKNNSN